jgi:hypothetical protein
MRTNLREGYKEGLCTVGLRLVTWLLVIGYWFDLVWLDPWVFGYWLTKWLCVGEGIIAAMRVTFPLIPLVNVRNKTP